MLVHQAFRFELDPADRTRSVLSSHCGAAAFAYNWGLALVVGRIEAGRVLTVLAVRQGASAAEAERWARGLVGPVPWSLPALRREWNRDKGQVAPWWAENSKEAYNSGLDALARALGNFFHARTGRRKGVVLPDGLDEHGGGTLVDHGRWSSCRHACSPCRRCSSGCRCHSAVISATAMRAEDSSTIAFFVA